MEAVLLNPEWPTSFRRSVRSAKGEVLRTIVFEHGKPQLLDDEDALAVVDDIGRALVRPAIGDDGLPMSKPARGVVAKEKAKGKKKRDG